MGSQSSTKVEKRKFTFDEMIDQLDEKNVQFTIINKEDAKHILEHSNYYYKLTAYRKNFPQNSQGKYIHLDFLLLSDLSTIDMRLRYLVLQMSLDIEHSIKTKILSDITNDPKEDGYTIVSDFLAKDNSSIDKYMHAMKSESHYNYGLYSKHHKNTPVWVLFEVITFGGFVKFVEFYYHHQGKPKEYAALYDVLRYVKNIRNAAAHNSPILMDIVSRQIFKSTVPTMSKFVGNINTISKDVRRKKLANRRVHDLTALLLIFDKFVKSDAIKEIRYNDLKDLLDRCKRRKDYYRHHNNIVSVYKYFSKIVDYLLKKV